MHDYITDYSIYYVLFLCLWWVYFDKRFLNSTFRKMRKEKKGKKQTEKVMQ